jgi:hypothetical protein
MVAVEGVVLVLVLILAVVLLEAVDAVGPLISSLVPNHSAVQTSFK